MEKRDRVIVWEEDNGEFSVIRGRNEVVFRGSQADALAKAEELEPGSNAKY
jgi:hypothetical protein